MIERLHTNHRMSLAVSAPLSGRLIALAGLVADDRSLDVAGQTADTLAKIDGLLAEMGVDKTCLISATIWLPDIADFDAMNEVWDAWVAKGQGPVRACVEAKLADPRLKVEIQVTGIAA